MADDSATSTVQTTNQAHRSPGFGLCLGIFALPFVFSWLTLRNGYSTLARVVSFVWLAVYLLAASGSSNAPKVQSVEGSQATEVVPDKTPPESDVPKLEVSANQLGADYADNEVAADLKYKGKLVRVTGPVETIGKDITDKTYIQLGSRLIGDPQCLFSSPLQESQIAKLHKGEKASVRGKVHGKFGNIIMRDCVLE